MDASVEKGKSDVWIGVWYGKEQGVDGSVEKGKCDLCMGE